MKACVRYAPMIGAREGELSEAEASALAAHLEACPRCGATAADLAATEGIVSEALMAAANARDFAPFVDGVMARIERPAAARAAGGVLAWAHRHWKAAAGALAPALAALALFMYVRVDHRPEEVALFELAAEGRVATVLETPDGPVVLLAPEESGS